jgi:tRNA-specific 2-thiouridylase
VVEIRSDENQVVVGRKEDVFSRAVTAEGATWVSGEAPLKTEGLLAQVRYRHQAAPGRLQVLSGGRLTFQFDEPQWAVTPGQALVLYEEDRVLGGAWIRKR